MTSIPDLIRAFAELETNSVVGIVNLGGIVSVTSLFVLSGLFITPPSTGKILMLKTPELGHLLLLIVLVISSTVVSGYFDTSRIENENTSQEREVES